MKWQAHRTTADGMFYTRKVRDGSVTVIRHEQTRKWAIVHNKKCVREDFRTAKEAREPADEAEAQG